MIAHVLSLLGEAQVADCLLRIIAELHIIFESWPA